MLKAHLTLAGGDRATIEGTPESLEKLLGLLGARNVSVGGKSKRRRDRTESESVEDTESVEGKPGLDLHELVNLAKSCDEAEAIETQMLDMSSQVDRTLLPLYLVHEHRKNNFALSSGEIAKVTRDLGVPVSQPNASKVLSGVGSRYVMGDTVRRKGRAVKYKLNRRGAAYLKSVIGGTLGENEG